MGVIKTASDLWKYKRFPTIKELKADENKRLFGFSADKPLFGQQSHVTVYRGETVKLDPTRRGGDWAKSFQDKGDYGRALRKTSGTFWSGNPVEARIAARTVGGSHKKMNLHSPAPVAVWTGSVRKIDALKGIKPVIEHDRVVSRLASTLQESDVFVKAEADLLLTSKKVDKVLRQKTGVRSARFYQTSVDPSTIENKRLHISSTAKVNPTFKGVKIAAAKSLFQLAGRTVAKFAPWGAGALLVHDTIKHGPKQAIENLMPAPLVNPKRFKEQRKTSPQSRLRRTLLKIKSFDPEGAGFDYSSAHAAGMRPLGGDGPNAGHYGSVVPVSPQQMQKFNLPSQSYMILKGRSHPTYSKAVSGEEARGYSVKKFGSRYFSVPKK